MFSSALSEMYKTEVPLYGDLLDLVADINAVEIHSGSDKQDWASEGTRSRLSVERHGAIRLGTARELATMRRLFAVMGMEPVGYYDLSAAGVPVHATAFRATGDDALARNPFRVFTSLLRLELIEDVALRGRAAAVLERRSIFSRGCLELVEKFESDGGLVDAEAKEFVAQALETFRWHGEAPVTLEAYRELRAAHPLIADVVCFKGPHINHLTPRVLDIDKAQEEMVRRGIPAKASIEGPPKRKVPILLRQTSFLALEEAIRFSGAEGHLVGTHTARFGEIEQRGCALTPKGRQLYDELLSSARAQGSSSEILSREFIAFPDDLRELHRSRLIHVRYAVGNNLDANGSALPPESSDVDLDALIDAGQLLIQPMVYEDFLPVSAAGIFQSNLGNENRTGYTSGSNLSEFEVALGVPVVDEFELYRAREAESLTIALQALGAAHAAASGAA